MHEIFQEKLATKKIQYEMNLIDESLPEKDQTLLEEEQPKLVFTDRKRLLQVSINLISNAIKFTRHKGKITVTLRLLDNKRTL